VTNRFRDAGYSRIQLHTEYYRLRAIKTSSAKNFDFSVVLVANLNTDRIECFPPIVNNQ